MILRSAAGNFCTEHGYLFLAMQIKQFAVAERLHNGMDSLGMEKKGILRRKKTC